MASEGWIKVRSKLKDDGRLLIVARKCNASTVTVFGALVTLWAYADDHADQEGVLYGWTPDDVDSRCGVPGFAHALPADWIDLTGEWVKLPEYQEHNGSTAKSRAMTTKRVQRHRRNAVTVNTTVPTSYLILSDLDPSTEGTSKDTVSPPPGLPKHFDPAKRCISTGRHALRKYPFIYIHQQELEDAHSQWEREGLSRDDWEDGLKRANVQLERKQHARDFTGGMAYAWIIGFLKDEAIKRAKERERLGQAKSGALPTRQTNQERIAQERQRVFDQFRSRGKAEDPDVIDVTPNEEKPL